jgi:hypothetical protein
VDASATGAARYRALRSACAGHAVQGDPTEQNYVTMKMAIAAALLCGLLVGQTAQAERAKIQRPYWVIIATIIDLRTGQPLDQGKLEGRELEFDDPGKCQSVVDRIRPIATDRVTAVLTCSRVGPVEETL